MIGKRSRICVSSQDIIDIIRESESNPPPKRDSMGRRPSPLGGIFWGDVEILALRPGLKIYTSDFRLDNELEVSSRRRFIGRVP
ncbi:MAG: hypothetical protein GY846_13555 [Deltaproteobacteria bacterium]|nr:hypothetical protein [Deltaproteobacteria bacterium]